MQMNNICTTSFSHQMYKKKAEGLMAPPMALTHRQIFTRNETEADIHQVTLSLSLWFGPWISRHRVLHVNLSTIIYYLQFFNIIIYQNRSRSFSEISFEYWSMFIVIYHYSCSLIGFIGDQTGTLFFK